MTGVVYALFGLLAVMVDIAGVVTVFALRSRGREPYVVREPERCASCGGVLPGAPVMTEGAILANEPVEFSRVPIPLPVIGEQRTQIYVRFKVCQGCMQGAMT